MGRQGRAGGEGWGGEAKKDKDPREEGGTLQRQDSKSANAFEFGVGEN